MVVSDVALPRDAPHAALQLLLGLLTLEEKIGLLSPSGELGNTCNDHTYGAPRVGLSHYMWLVEANTGANSACIGGPEHKCSTTFNGPLGMGASFNRTSWYFKGNVIGTEMRACVAARPWPGHATPRIAPSPSHSHRSAR